MRFLATAAPGLESLLEEELAELGIVAGKEGEGAVVFEGEWEEAAKALVYSRLASRVMVSLRQFSAKSPEMLYDQVRRIDWAELCPEGTTMAVFTHGKEPAPNVTLSFAALKIKDAVCDEIRKSGRERPDVERRDPGLRIEAMFSGGRCELSVDLSGFPLHRRGYREEGGIAPLRENRAAGLLRFARYDGSRPFIDPFCGTGTIAIEAALIAMKRAPGTLRAPRDFAAWNLIPECRPALEAVWNKAKSEGLSKPPHPILASDIEVANLRRARANAERAGLGRTLSFEQDDALNIQPMEDALVAANPPYGERIGDIEKATRLMTDFASALKQSGTKVSMAIVVPKGDLEKSVGLRTSRKMSIENGPLASRYLLYDIYPGKKVVREDD